MARTPYGHPCTLPFGSGVGRQRREYCAGHATAAMATRMCRPSAIATKDTVQGAVSVVGGMRSSDCGGVGSHFRGLHGRTGAHASDALRGSATPGIVLCTLHCERSHYRQILRCQPVMAWP